jgi:hypothetical protein
MLMALLYREENEIAAAAPACDQIPYGDAYWTEIFGGEIGDGPFFETAYITINDPQLRRQLLLLGIDDQVCGRELAQQIEAKLTPSYLGERAA